MKKTITLISLLTVGCTNANTARKDMAVPHNKELSAKAPEIAVPNMPLYDNFGRRIVFVEAQDYKPVLGIFNWSAASSYIAGIPTVEYNAVLMRKYPQEYQTFYFFHEVGHFKLGHLGSPPEFIPPNFDHTRLAVSEEEYGADCYSMRYLKEKLQYAPKQLEKVLDNEKNNFSDMPSAREGLLECLVYK